MRITIDLRVGPHGNMETPTKAKIQYNIDQLEDAMKFLGPSGIQSLRDTISILRAIQNQLP